MIDGRYRLPCILISLLHASSRSSRSSRSSSSSSVSSANSSASLTSTSASLTSTSNNSSGPIILLHDCLVNQNNSKIYYSTQHLRIRKHYEYVNTILDMIDTTADTLCVYQRKSTTTDQMIYDMWMKYQDEIV